MSYVLRVSIHLSTCITDTCVFQLKYPQCPMVEMPSLSTLEFHTMYVGYSIQLLRKSFPNPHQVVRTAQDGPFGTQFQIYAISYIITSKNLKSLKLSKVWWNTRHPIPILAKCLIVRQCLRPRSRQNRWVRKSFSELRPSGKLVIPWSFNLKSPGRRSAFFLGKASE